MNVTVKHNHRTNIKILDFVHMNCWQKLNQLMLNTIHMKASIRWWGHFFWEKIQHQILLLVTSFQKILWAYFVLVSDHQIYKNTASYYRKKIPTSQTKVRKDSWWQPCQSNEPKWGVTSSQGVSSLTQPIKIREALHRIRTKASVS